MNKGNVVGRLLRSALVRARTDSKGSVAITFSLTLVAIFGAVGIAVDFSRANSVKAQLQSALDSALLSVAREAAAGSVADVAGAVQKAFDANLSTPEATSVQVTSQFDMGSSTLTGQATGLVQARFVNLLGFGALNIAVRSKVRASLAQGCVLSLNSNATEAVKFTGSSDVELKNCTLYVNSKDSSALAVTGAAKVKAYYVGVVGGVNGASKITATKGVETGTKSYADPYAGRTVPSFSGCTQTNYVVPSGFLDPGVYCGGLTFNAGVQVTLRPGIYFIDRGTFYVASTAKITGTGVTLIFTSSTGANWATADIKGASAISLTAPTTGPTAGLVLFGDPKMATGTTFNLSGGSDQIFGGAIYLPKARLNYAGGAATDNGCTQLIADTIAMTGQSSLTIKCGGYATQQIGKNSVALVQ